MRIDLGEDEQPEIGLVALIDCIFFLLMFFMVATSFKQQDMQKKEKALPLVLPTSAVSLEKAQARSGALVVGVDAQGHFYVDGSVVGASGLSQRLRREVAANPKLAVRIDGDRHTAYQDVVHVLDLCQFEGIVDIAMRVKN